jgi:GntR family phosphonate transport system transcriptional regulator
MSPENSRTPIWRAIATTLEADIAGGHYRPGDRLPTEADLSRRFGVNRHTVRQALADLAGKGLVMPRRGAGVFVTAQPQDYPIGRRVRFSQNLLAAGQTPARQMLALELRGADATEAAALALPQDGMVLAYEGISLADGQPIALFRSIFPAAPYPGLQQAIRDHGSVTAALAACGVPDYLRKSTRLTAKLATATQARHLRIREGAPILRSVGINILPSGQPVEYGATWFAGDRVSLTLQDG